MMHISMHHLSPITSAAIGNSEHLEAKRRGRFPARGRHKPTGAGSSIWAKSSSIDKTNGISGIADRSVAGTKGSHVVLDNPSLFESFSGCMISFDGPDGRECFCIRFLAKSSSERPTFPLKIPTRFPAKQEKSHTCSTHFGLPSPVLMPPKTISFSPTAVSGLLHMHYTVREISYLVGHEMAQTIVDILVRRTTIAFAGAVEDKSIREITSIFGEVRDWTPEQIQREAALAIERLVRIDHDGSQVGGKL